MVRGEPSTLVNTARGRYDLESHVVKQEARGLSPQLPRGYPRSTKQSLSPSPLCWVKGGVHVKTKKPKKKCGGKRNESIQKAEKMTGENSPLGCKKK